MFLLILFKISSNCFPHFSQNILNPPEFQKMYLIFVQPSADCTLLLFKYSIFRPNKSIYLYTLYCTGKRFLVKHMPAHSLSYENADIPVIRNISFSPFIYYTLQIECVIAYRCIIRSVSRNPVGACNARIKEIQTCSDIILSVQCTLCSHN